jgi:hypothetical protein
MCQHVCYRDTMSAEEMKVELRRRLKNNISPLSANMRQFVPPTLAGPANDHQVSIVMVIFVSVGQPIEIKDIKKHVIIEDMDAVIGTSR